MLLARYRILVVLLVCAICSALDVDDNVFMQTGQHRRAVGSNTGGGSPQPHILLIVGDDFGYNDIGYHQNVPTPVNPSGQNTTNVLVRTPYLDALAMEGVKLESYYTQTTCSPSRASIMTGRYGSHTGMGDAGDSFEHGYGLPLEQLTLAQVLSSAGYATHIIGKWHLGHCHELYTPTFRGFDSFEGFFLGAGDYWTHMNSNFLDFRSSGLTSSNNLPPVSNSSWGKFSADVFVDRVEYIVQSHAQAHGIHGKPSFVFLSLQSVHSPYQVPDKYLQMYSSLAKFPHRRMIAAMVTAMDDTVGKVVQAYKDGGLWDRTVLVFTTDNGGHQEEHQRDSSNFPLRGGKDNFWEGGIRGNAFVRGSAEFPIPAGRHTLQLMHVTDWLPTFARLAGASIDGGMRLDGHDIWDVLSKDASGTRTSIVHECTGAEDAHSGVYRKGNFKLIYSGSLRHGRDVQYLPDGFTDRSLVCELPQGMENFSEQKPKTRKWVFDIDSDPYECHNLADHTEFADIIAEMDAELEEYHKTAVQDLALVYTALDPAADPALRADKAWGPYVGSQICTV